MKNAALAGSWMLPPRFQRNAWEARQREAGWDSLWQSLRGSCEQLWEWSQMMQWRPQEVGDCRNMECVPRKARGSKHKQHRREERGHVSAACNAVGAGSSHHTSVCPRCLLFVLLGFGLALVQAFLPFGVGMFNLYNCILGA
jgi:hypothetical protein